MMEGTRGGTRSVWGVLVGALATIGLIGYLYMANSLWQVPFVPLDITELIICLTPGPIATAGIKALGAWAQRILKVVGLLLMLGVGAALGAWAVNREPAPKVRRSSFWYRTALLAGVAFLATLAVEAGLGRLGRLWGINGVILVGSYLTWAAFVTWAVYRPIAADVSAVPEAQVLGRRRFLIRLAVAAAAVAAGGYALGEQLRPKPRVAELPPLPTPEPANAPGAALPALTSTLTPGAVATPVSQGAAATATILANPTTPVLATPVPPPDTSLPTFSVAPDTRPNITPIEDFYEVDIDPIKPVVEVARWRLQIKGMVDNPLTLTFEDLLGFPRVDVYGTLECISNEVGGDLISTTLFSGTRLRDVLAKAGPMSGVAEVMFRSLDGYTESIPWDKAEHPDTLLVYGMDGKTLRQEHGYPLRLFNPNHYGMKNPKWLAEIELIPNEYNGYWEVRGWDKEAIVKTTSVTDIKGKLEVVNSLA